VAREDLTPEIAAYYERGNERDRLLSGAGLLEFCRSPRR
jgi:hypothetical protein